MSLARLAAGLLLLSAAAAQAEDLAFKLRALPEFHHANAASPFASAQPQPAEWRDGSRQEAEARWSGYGIGAVLTAVSTARDGQRQDNRLVVNELHYDGELYGQRFGLGKKVLSWDVGFGFRPLDVIQQENRRRIFATPLEGIPYLAWEGYTADSAWMLVMANPGRGRADDPHNDESVAFKYYVRHGATDWHGVLRTSRRNGLEGGAAFSRVEGDSLEWHGSVLTQERYEKLLNPLADAPAPTLALADPLLAVRHRRGMKALLGTTWTGESGFSLLAEAWYDRSAHTRAEWRTLAALARRQQTLAGMPGIPPEAVAGNLAYSLRYFETPNLLPANLLLRLSRRAEGESLEPAIDVLYTPADGGSVVTVSLGYEADRYRLDAGVRSYGGRPDSAYRLLPEGRVAYLALQLAF